jgi:hypothetical protein
MSSKSKQPAPMPNDEGQKNRKNANRLRSLQLSTMAPLAHLSRAMNLEIRTPKLQNPAQGFLPPTLTTG